MKIPKSKLLLFILLDLIILGLLVFFSPLAIITIAFFILFTAFFFISPLGYLYFLILWAFYEGLIVSGVEEYRVFRLIALILILILAWIKYWIQGNTLKLPSRAISIPIIVFLIWSGLSVIISPYPSACLIPYLKLGSYCAILLLIYNLINNTQDLKKVLRFLVISQIPVFFVAFYQAVYLHAPRAWGINANSNTLGINSFLCFVSALLLLRIDGESITRKFLWYILLCLSILTMILSGSRDSIFAFIIFIAAYLIINRRYKTLLIMLLSIIAAGAFILSSRIATINLVAAARLMSGTTGRTLIWGESLQVIRDNPLFGVGFGGVGKVLYGYANATNPIVASHLREVIEKGNIHNGYLQKLAELGVIGLIIIIWANLKFLKHLRCKLTILPQPISRILSNWALALFVGLLCYAFFESALPIGPLSVDAGVLLLLVPIARLFDMESRAQIILS